MSKRGSGVDRPPRVGTCVGCRLAVYAGDEVEYLGEKMHKSCLEDQRRAVERWNEDVRENNKSTGGGK